MAVTQYTTDDAALTALDGTYYAAAQLHKFTINDKQYAADTSDNLNRGAGYGNAHDDSFNGALEFNVRAACAVAGAPGDFYPTTGTLPADLAELQDWAVIADPLALWTTGDSVVLGDASEAHWDGDAWASGAAPA